MYFPLNMIPVNYNEQYGYVINFKELKYLNEMYGLNYNESIYCLLNENNIINENINVAINIYEIIDNPYIINEFSNIIIVSPSVNQLTKKYIDFVLESSDIIENQYEFIYEGIINDRYIDEFILNEINIISNITNATNNITGPIRTFAKNMVGDVKNNIQNYQNQYIEYRDSYANGNTPTLQNKVKALGTVGIRNIGDALNVYSNIEDSGPPGSAIPELEIAKRAVQTYFQNEPYFTSYAKIHAEQLANKASNIKSNISTKITSLKSNIENIKRQMSQSSDMKIKQQLQNKLNIAQNVLQQLINNKK